MNKKNFAKIISLHSMGVTPQVCVLAILQMELGQSTTGTDQREAAKSIAKFYDETTMDIPDVIHGQCHACKASITIEVPKR